MVNPGLVHDEYIFTVNIQNIFAFHWAKQSTTKIKSKTKGQY